MPTPIKLHPEAQAELNDAGAFYGARLIQHIGGALAQIADMPRAWPTLPASPDVHRRVLTKWPYAIVYALEPSWILVVAIEHTRRRPGYWVTRL